MKHLFGLLLVANVVFYLWESGAGRGDGAVQRIELSLPDETEKIVLISELPAVPTKAPEAPVPDGVQAKPAEPGPGEGEAAAPQAAPDTAAETAPPASEPMISDCFLLGPYVNEVSARNAVEAVREHVESAEVIAGEGDVADGFWVLYPKAETLQAAKANRKMLIEKGIPDVWVLDKGELAGAISMGLFKTRERAEIAQKRFFEQNIAVEVKPRLTRAPAHWIQIRQTADRERLEKTLADTLANRSGNAEVKLKVCD